MVKNIALLSNDKMTKYCQGKLCLELFQEYHLLWQWFFFNETFKLKGNIQIVNLQTLLKSFLFFSNLIQLQKLDFIIDFRFQL